jgi:colicin import membrane protein
MRVSVNGSKGPQMTCLVLVAMVLAACAVEAGEEAAHAIADKFAQEADQAATRQRAQSATRPSSPAGADEADILNRARAERPAPRSRDDALRQDRSAAAALEAQREEEGRQLVEKLKRAQAARAALKEAERKSVATAPDALGGPQRPAADVSRPPPGARDSTRVSILLLMEPGHRGIRRFAKTADPVLCMGDQCYVSRGAGTDAVAMPRFVALGPGNTLGPRAGACNQSLGCVFRNVDLHAASATVQPVDLRILRHDRRQPSEVRVDPSCRTVAARLTCERTVRAPDYTLWVVPETLAAQVGGAGLLTALYGGLATDRSAALDPRWGRRQP